ncbi:MAG: metallophosphoesterase [Alphaproteobacteria bacterium]|nr:metallophosphoesterase [Alphaproteobacteria bacterium]
MRRAAAIASVVLAATATPAAADTTAPWVVLGPDGAVVRVATTDAACPRIRYDDFDRPMQVRVGPWEAYPHTVCEAPLPAIVQRASFAGRAIPLPRPEPRRIVVLGDSGCRLKGGSVQACNDPAQWPFARIAAAAAAMAPDLVIHVGDYHYRETPCPQPGAGCEGSPYGYNWGAWRADFFDPAAPLLAAAPWVMVRGNHEDCERAGHGWFRYLDPRPRPPDCEGFTEPYRIAFGDFSLVVHDSAIARDQNPRDAEIERHRGQLAAARALATPESWLLTHRPLYGVYKFEPTTRRPILTNETLQAAAAALGPDPFRAVFSGHIHRFDAFSFAGGQPAQVVVGGGGTALDPSLDDPPPDLAILGARVSRLTSTTGYAFLFLERGGAGWAGALYDADGRARLRCRLDGKTMECDP